MESSNEHAATAASDVTFGIGRLSGEIFAELTDLMDHYGDGLRMRHISPVISDGGVDKPRKNPGHSDFDWHKQRVQELRRRRSSVGIDDGMSIHHAMTEV